MSWAVCLRGELSYSYIWLACTPAVLWLSRRFRIERGRWRRNLPIHALAMLLFVAATKIVYEAIGNPHESALSPFSWARLFRSIESTFDTGALLYIVLVLIEHAIDYYRRYQRGLVHAATLQTQLVQSQLQALKMQLHPHFLFNALHTVAALVHEDPDNAERTIARLGELLRLFLANSSIHETPLGEELRILDLYLDIERARFEERLQVHYDVPASLRAAMVPNLVLQPLVENSIRHGIGKRAAGGCVRVIAERAGDTLLLRVTDNGEGLERAADRVHTGLGLSITRGRLESLYGARQSLVLSNRKEGGVEARIALPYRIALAKEEKDHVEFQSTDC
jgi:LytS/YehU family sensor histidine kinase